MPVVRWYWDIVGIITVGICCILLLFAVFDFHPAWESVLFLVLIGGLAYLWILGVFGFAPAWSPCGLRPGRRYRVTKSFSADGKQFCEGDVLVFEGESGKPISLPETKDEIEDQECDSYYILKDESDHHIHLSQSPRKWVKFLKELPKVG